MKGFNNQDRGVSKKTPLIFYPKNNIEYFNGDIPKFNKTLISKDIYDDFLIHTSFKRNSVNRLRKKLIKKLSSEIIYVEHDQEKERLELTTNDSFSFWDSICIDDLFYLKDGLEKELIINAFKQFPNSNEYHINSFKDLADLEEEYEDYNHFAHAYLEMESIEKLFEYKNKSSNKNILNKYTYKLVNYMESIRDEIYEMICYMGTINPEDVFEPIYVTSELSDLITCLFPEMMSKENYSSRVYMYKDSTIEDRWKSQLFNRSNQIKEDFNKIFIEWQTEQEEILSKH